MNKKQPGSTHKLRQFFWPSSQASFTRRMAPYVILAFIGLVIFIGGAAGWNYTNSSQFCGTTCHTMPPEYSTYLRSPHARVACVECHIGRESLDVMIGRKVGHLHTVTSMILKTYEFPIIARKMRPANESCETCHLPTKFSTDSLREVRSHLNDLANTPISTFLLLKTGGGAKREGLGRGIHWHIDNNVYFYATDPLEQNIPYVRVVNDDGSVDEYIDVDSGFTPEMIQDRNLRKVDCITCHNRVSHSVPSPAASVDTAIYSGAISDSLPEVRRVAVELLGADYADDAAANSGFDSLANFYQQNYPQVYADKHDVIQKTVEWLKSTYALTRFPLQKLDWQTHPNNIGHKDSPGCFRCHDGKHLNANQKAIPLECNLCHSLPAVADPSQFISTVEVARTEEPASHTLTQWIALHGRVIDTTCTDCHSPGESGPDYTTLDGQIPPLDDKLFCGNSACHGTVWKYAGFDSPGLRLILDKQLLNLATP